MSKAKPCKKTWFRVHTSAEIFLFIIPAQNHQSLSNCPCGDIRLNIRKITDVRVE